MRNTPNYNLPQFDGTDKFDKDVLNDAYMKLDDAINDLQETFNLGAGDAGLLSKEVVEARKGKSKLADKITELEGKDAGFNDFKANGGTIGGSLVIGDLENSDFKQLVMRRKDTDGIKQVADISINNNAEMFTGLNHDGGRVVNGLRFNAFHEILPSNGGVTIFGNIYEPFKDIHLSGVNKSSNGYTKLPNGVIMQWLETTIRIHQGQASGAYLNTPTELDKDRVCFLGANVSARIEGSGIITDSDIERVIANCYVSNNSQIRLKVCDINSKVVEYGDFKVKILLITY